MSAKKGAGGVPVQLLLEAEQHKVTVEMKNGEIYRGLLISSEETMNVSLIDVILTARDGRVSKLHAVYLRGSNIRFIVLPDVLRDAPLFNKVRKMKKTMEEKVGTGFGGGGSKRKRTV
eukprot:CAMPEP_0194276958 /NCGR_PEP_ID=MMETSP0169-20130528/9415_1 /TAXON_ID=218684 /ORGANISM="Corethron pennatum, Strain L29A3" /LENGTH=117 /DNA_ID=CAMNT_0039020805 /DNA_START=132 /DNA_END=485 /DNA_ORIENTATION=+